MAALRTQTQLTEDQVIDALRVKCTGDAFFAGAKLGPSWGGPGVRIMDAVSLRKSWSRPCINGYEVKVAHSDFTRDEKWPDYLASCNRFYWACPKSLIWPEEIDPRCGLIWVSEKGVAHTRRAAPYRTIESPEGLLMYLIMWRLDGLGQAPRIITNRAFIQQWLEGKQADRGLGARFAGRLVERLEELTERLRKLETEPDNWVGVVKDFGIKTTWELRDRLNEKPTARILRALDGAVIKLDGVRKLIDREAKKAKAKGKV